MDICKQRWLWRLGATRSRARLVTGALFTPGQRWLDVVPERAALIVSRENLILWATANRAAFRSGAFLATHQRTTELPAVVPAHGDQACTGDYSQHVPPWLWFEREPEDMVLTEMTRMARAYDRTLTLLHLPAAERRGREDEDEEGWMPGKRLWQPPVRNLNRSGWSQLRVPPAPGRVRRL